jgi:hypothetical protein
MRPPCLIRPASALIGWQHTLWVDVMLEPVEERLPRVRRHPSTVVAGVHCMGGDARAQTALLRRQSV